MAPVGSAAAPRVLLVEDDRVIADAVARRLRGTGYDVEVFHDGASAGRGRGGRGRRSTSWCSTSLLPGLDGLEVCRRVQAREPVPVLMLTARGEETDRLVGLGVGADDYLAKPFSQRELVARVAALLRRVERAAALAAGTAAGACPREVRVGPLLVDGAARRVTGDGGERHLTRTEFDLLWALARRGRRGRRPDPLLVEALRWPSVAAAELAPPAAVRTIDSHVKALRRKLGAGVIRTVPGVGYALEAGEG